MCDVLYGALLYISVQSPFFSLALLSLTVFQGLFLVIWGLVDWIGFFAWAEN
jgi:hypothetical protein